jgi:nicotinamide mononucleotide adenylyltransferase
MTLWLFIGRLNPPHIWHITVIDKALSLNDTIILMIWTKWGTDEKNPLTFSQIRKILSEKYDDRSKLKILELEDNLSDLVWVQDIVELLYKHWEWIRKINFYGGDFKNDSAYKALKEYQNELKDYEINYIEVSRENSFVEYNWQKYEISATNLRTALREKNFELAEKFCDEKMFELIREYF